MNMEDDKHFRKKSKMTRMEREDKQYYRADRKEAKKFKRKLLGVDKTKYQR